MAGITREKHNPTRGEMVLAHSLPCVGSNDLGIATKNDPIGIQRLGIILSGLSFR